MCMRKTRVYVADNKLDDRSRTDYLVETEIERAAIHNIIFKLIFKFLFV